jgi:2-polyprenyl-3-methyl-5-hydroxy-6-metoxy-1,4-benzoquinol methylase
MSDKNYINYWDLNIKKWGELYFNKNLHKEDVNANFITKKFYQKFIFPLERSVMQQRYELTIEFINSFNKGEALFVNDIGCGTGLFSNILITKNFNVNSIDFSKTALEATLDYVKSNNEEKLNNHKTFNLNAIDQKLPESDHSICMGVLPYIKEKQLDSFFNNICTFKRTMLINWVDEKNLNNKIRKLFKFLNVRNLNFQSSELLAKIYKKNNCTLVKNIKSGTGFLHIIKKDF